MLTLMLNYRLNIICINQNIPCFVSSIHFPLQFPLWILISFVSVYANEDIWTNKNCTTPGIQLRRFSSALICQYHFYRTSKALPKSCSSYLRRSLIQNPLIQDIIDCQAETCPTAICSVTQLSVLLLGCLNDLQATWALHRAHTICLVQIWF